MFVLIQPCFQILLNGSSIISCSNRLLLAELIMHSINTYTHLKVVAFNFICGGGGGIWVSQDSSSVMKVYFLKINGSLIFWNPFHCHNYKENLRVKPVVVLPSEGGQIPSTAKEMFHLTFYLLGVALYQHWYDYLSSKLVATKPDIHYIHFWRWEYDWQENSWYCWPLGFYH